MKSLKSVAVIILLLAVGGALLACASQAPASPSPAANVPAPTAPAGEAVDAGTGATDSTAEGAETVTSSPGVADTGTTLILIAGDVTTLEPYRLVSIHPDGSVASHLWDTLTLLNDDLKVEPHVAESWRLVNNFTWEFKLHPGIVFHNGEPLNAEAVRFSIERARSMPGSLETFATDVDLQQVKVLDDQTLHIVTRQPVANLPYYLAFLEILPPVYYSETSPDQLAIAPIGSGPYQLSNWIPGQELVLEANPAYWQGEPALPRLVFQVVPSAEDRLAALRDGSAALVTDLPPIPPAEWDSPTSRLEAIEGTQRIFIGMRIEDGSPLADKRVRQALNYGVNVEPIVNDWFAGYGQRYGSWVNPPWDNPELTPWPYDPDLARDLLAEAGYQQGFTTTLRAPIGAYHQAVSIADTIALQLAEIGVSVEVETADWTAYEQDLLAGEVAPLFFLGLNSHADGLEDVRNLSSSFTFNPAGWHNGAFEDILAQATNTFNDNSRSRLLNEAQSIAYDEAPWIWLWRPYQFYGINQRLDWAPRRDGLVHLYQPKGDPVGSAE